MSTRDQPESGLFTGRAEFYREAVTGQFNSDPEYQFFSDNPREVTHTQGVSVERRDGLGTADAVDHDKGNEEPEIELVYDLQRELIADDGSHAGASADAIVRTADNRIKNTHHVRLREERDASDPEDPDNTTGARNYVIGQGCHPNVEMEMDPEGGTPVAVTLTYMAEKVRDYDIYQPPGDQALTVESTDSNDTSQTLTIEDDAGATEDVSLDGTNPKSTSKADWDSIRGLELDLETQGDVVVKLGSTGEEIARTRGAVYHSQDSQPVEGDKGVPVVGGGSLASTIGSAFEYFNGAKVERGGSVLPYDLNRLTLSCENNYGRTTRHSSTRMRINEGNRGVTMESDVVGWGASVQYHDEALGVQKDDITIELPSTVFTLVSAAVQEAGDKERASDDTAIEYSVTFEPSNDGGITVAQP